MASTATLDVNGANRSIELFVRSLAPPAAHKQQEKVIDRLTQLEAHDHIAEFTIHVWGERLDPTSAAAQTDTGQFVKRRINEFRRWATLNGFSTGSFFQEEAVKSTITGDEYTSMVLPTLAVAEYVGHDLVFVSPCTDGDTVHTIEDRLNELSESATIDTSPQAIKSGESD